jgi:hypothetical protein
VCVANSIKTHELNKQHDNSVSSDLRCTLTEVDLCHAQPVSFHSQRLGERAPKVCQEWLSSDQENES